MPLFIAPRISELQLIDLGSGVGSSKNKNFIWIWISIGILIVASFIAYVLLKKWYGKKYEKKLFKNKNQLYNLSQYIHDSKSQKLPETVIKQNLKKSGWTNEQIRFAMRNYSGKKTGMY